MLTALSMILIGFFSCRGIARFPALLVDNLAAAIAAAMSLRDQRYGRAFGETGVSAMNIADLWRRDGSEQRLLRRATQSALEFTNFITQFPRQSDRGIRFARALTAFVLRTNDRRFRRGA